MKLCKDCRHYGGILMASGRYVCNHPRNQAFIHPVDGLEHSYDAFYLRLAPEMQVVGCGMDAKWWEKRNGDAFQPDSKN